MAAKTPKIATMGNLIAAGLTFIVGITFTFMGGYARLNYGPDSQFAQFTASAALCSSFRIHVNSSIILDAPAAFNDAFLNAAVYVSSLLCTYYLYVLNLRIASLSTWGRKHAQTGPKYQTCTFPCQGWCLTTVYTEKAVVDGLANETMAKWSGYAPGVV